MLLLVGFAEWVLLGSGVGCRGSGDMIIMATRTIQLTFMVHLEEAPFTFHTIDTS